MSDVIHTKLGEGRRVAIPAELCRRYGLQPGDAVVLEPSDKGITLRPLDEVIREVHTHGVNSCAFSPDGTRSVSASSDGTLKVWDGSSYKTLSSLRALPEGAYASFDSDNILIACSENAWPYLARRCYDPKAKRERLLPAEFFGPLPIANPDR